MTWRRSGSAHSRHRATGTRRVTSPRCTRRGSGRCTAGSGARRSRDRRRRPRAGRLPGGAAQLPGFDGANPAGAGSTGSRSAPCAITAGAPGIATSSCGPRDVALDEVASAAAGSDEQLDRLQLERRFYDLVHQLNPAVAKQLPAVRDRRAHRRRDRPARGDSRRHRANPSVSRAQSDDRARRELTGERGAVMQRLRDTEHDVTTTAELRRLAHAVADPEPLPGAQDGWPWRSRCAAAAGPLRQRGERRSSRRSRLRSPAPWSSCGLCRGGGLKTVAPRAPRLRPRVLAGRARRSPVLRR